MSVQPTLLDTLNATFSVASVAGPSLYGSPDGPTIDESGPEVAPANRTRRRGSRKATPTSETSGQTSTGSSASAALTLSLVSKLRTLLDTDGSMEFVQTWREKITPAGRSYSQLVASARRSSDNESGGSLFPWPVPTSTDGRGPDHGFLDGWKRPSGANRSSTLDTMVSLVAPWPAPQVHQGPNNGENRGQKYGGKRARKTPQNIPDLLAPWAAPASRDHKDSPGMATEGINPDGTTRARNDQLPRQVHGISSASCIVETGRPEGLVLNAAMNRWLMGFQRVVDRCSPCWKEWDLIAGLLNDANGPQTAFWQRLAEIALADSKGTETPLSRRLQQSSLNRSSKLKAS